MLENQIQIYSVDTGDFYSNREMYLHWLNHRLRTERNVVKNKLEKIKSIFSEKGLTQNNIKELCAGNYDCFGDTIDEDTLKLCYDCTFYYDLIERKNKLAKETKNRLLKLLENKIKSNIETNGKHHIRMLREDNISKKNIISVFDSSLIRMMGIKPDEFTDNFMVVQIYYFDVIKDLIYYGFTYKGEKYRYFTSSAGQIRTKKAVFIKESIWNKYEKTIMCGLTIDSINKKGGNNPNKHLAYMALTNSATDIWEDFDIDKSIVIDDFETEVLGTYDLISDDDYTIKRTTGCIPITHTDGAGMILNGKNRMVRLPWIKGLLAHMDYVKFIKVNGCSPVIKDIYGKEYNVIEEDIQVIFTKSQFKLYKYYDSWDEYKEYFKKYNCTANFTNMEEDRIKDATINYQMLQTLTDFTESDIENIASSSIVKLNNLCKSLKDVKKAFGITPYNVNKTYLQKSIDIYPDLINDEYLKTMLRSVKDSLVKRYKSGKLEIKGKYTFILPDMYAACEYWFMGDKNPKGLLDDNEVFCWLFRKHEKLDCLRSPHLYKEHAVRFNMAYDGFPDKKDKIREWFDTNAVYTSCHDMISKILQFDVDGDVALVVADREFVKIAERNMKNIVPLYYNMRKAESSILTNESIYEGLNAAFTGSNIGMYSNNISKIWNDEVFVNGSEEEKQKAVDAVKLLCMENNFVIDRAKTLYMPTRPEWFKSIVSSFTNKKVPHFFTYAKDKPELKVENNNNCFVNCLENLIPNPRINCRGLNLGEIDYKVLMNNQDIKFDIEFDEHGRIIKEKTEPLVVKYIELNQKYHFQINFHDTDLITDFRQTLSKSQIKNNLFYKTIGQEVRECMRSFGYSENDVVDILVKYLYGIKKSKSKELLWFCYGKYIYENIKNNLIKLPKEFRPKKIKTIQCIDCGEWIDIPVTNTKTTRCLECQDEHDKARKRVWKSQKIQK